MVLTLGRILFGFYKRSDCKCIALLYALLFIWPVELCVKSPEHYYKSYKMRSHVLVYKEFQPVELENSYGASGPIDATDLVDRVPHKRLVRFNINNTKIIFIKENARWMTKTLRKHLLDLNQHIENQWPGRDVYIQVHDTWNPRNFRKKVTPMGTENHQSFTMDHFHWAGRGIDMSLVSEGFISKDFHPGKLAQLALYSAGFDWCIYKYTNLLHCSVKRDSAKSADWYGCFANNSTVYVEQKNEFIKMKNLKIGDRVLTIAKNGEVRFSPVIGFFHQSFIETERFVEIRTVNNSQSIHISPEHLIYRVSRSNFTYRNPFTKTEREKAATELFIHHKEVIFASSVIPGDFIFIVDLHKDLQVQKVDKVIKYVVKQGKIAPLTQEGNLIVNSIFVSCISSFKNENYAFLALYPYFMISKFWHGASNFLCYYTSFLIKLAELFFPFYFYKET
uniref:Hedgehog protein n=1 Tax=Schmidtea mediterranea TaxID=79327 RepID=D2ILR9_SCHMD|nr:hedgehog-like protein [Schmidtea mediterranea]